MRILIANRGEIAARIIRTASRLGMETVAAYADPDRDAPHVRSATLSTRLGPSELAASYLSIDAMLSAAERTGSTAVHPGYGFLSERADFARAVEAAGMVWIGPRPEAIEMMGSKIEARRLAAAAGVPIIPGFEASQDNDELAHAAAEIGFPVLIKASAGGGGKGIRIANTPDEFATALTDARLESQRAFGDDAVIVERYITRPRHVEVQIVGDRHGHVIDLGTRECSVQRRYQKVMEEAPAPNIGAVTESTLRSSALVLAKAIGYDSLGTVEFVVDDRTGDAFFLEMNTRLQVEHPVTEAVTGLDLVELQIRVAMGECPTCFDGPVSIVGHAFEARINAEDPARGFMAQTGTVSVVSTPADARWDSGIESGSVITPFYDSMIGKLIVHGADRDAARRRLVAALDQVLIAGVRTNVGFQRWLLMQDPIVAGRVTTRFLDESPLPDDTTHDENRALAAIAWLAALEQAAADGDVWRRMGRRRFTPHTSMTSVLFEDLDGATVEVLVGGTSASFRVEDGATYDDVSLRAGCLRWTSEAVTMTAPAHVDRTLRRVAVALRGHTETFVLRDHVGAGRGEGGSLGTANAVVAPFPALVAEVHVRRGDAVRAGQVVIVLEAMKILHSLAASGDGVVASVRVVPGEQVASRDVLITFEEADDGRPDDGK